MVLLQTKYYKIPSKYRFSTFIHGRNGGQFTEWLLSIDMILNVFRGSVVPDSMTYNANTTPKNFIQTIVHLKTLVLLRKSQQIHLNCDVIAWFHFASFRLFCTKFALEGLFNTTGFHFLKASVYWKMTASQNWILPQSLSFITLKCLHCKNLAVKFTTWVVVIYRYLSKKHFVLHNVLKEHLFLPTKSLFHWCYFTMTLSCVWHHPLCQLKHPGFCSTYTSKGCATIRKK